MMGHADLQMLGKVYEHIQAVKKVSDAAKAAQDANPPVILSTDRSSPVSDAAKAAKKANADAKTKKPRRRGTDAA